MPRRRKTPDPTLEAVIERHDLKPASGIPKQLPVPTLEAESRAQDPMPDQVTEPETTHRDRVRSDGVRKSDEPRSSFTSTDLRVTKDGHMWQVEVNRDLSANEYARLQASGFEDVSEGQDGRLWNASQQDLNRAETDINHVAFALGKQPEGRGR